MNVSQVYYDNISNLVSVFCVTNLLINLTEEFEAFNIK